MREVAEENWCHDISRHEKRAPNAPVRLLTPFDTIFPDVGVCRPPGGWRKIIRAQRAGDGVERPGRFCSEPVLKEGVDPNKFASGTVRPPTSAFLPNVRVSTWYAEDGRMLGFFVEKYCG